MCLCFHAHRVKPHKRFVQLLLPRQSEQKEERRKRKERRSSSKIFRTLRRKFVFVAFRRRDVFDRLLVLYLSESFSDLPFGDKRRKHHVEGEEEGSNPTHNAQDDERPSKAVPTKTKDVSLCKMIVQSTDHQSRKEKDRNTCIAIHSFSQINHSAIHSMDGWMDGSRKRERERHKPGAERIKDQFDPKNRCPKRSFVMEGMRVMAPPYEMPKAKTAGYK